MALKRKITKDEHAKLAKDLQSEYRADGDGFVLETEGDDDTSGLKSALAKERESNKEFKRQVKEWEEKMATFEGIDPTQVRELMAKFEGDDEMKLIKAGKLDEVFNKRTEKLRAELQKKLDAKDVAIKVEQERTARYQQRVLDNHLRAAATKAGIHANAVEDALLRGRTLFTLDENDNAIQLDESKHPKIGKDGKTAFGPLEWLEGMKESAPHWFPANSSGSGAGGGKGNGVAGKTMLRADFEALGVTEKHATMKAGTKVVDAVK